MPTWCSNQWLVKHQDQIRIAFLFFLIPNLMTNLVKILGQCATWFIRFPMMLLQ